jgi:hypothetical protein
MIWKLREYSGVDVSNHIDPEELDLARIVSISLLKRKQRIIGRSSLKRKSYCILVGLIHLARLGGMREVGLLLQE